MQTLINGVTIHYVEQGAVTALPVVFIHGFPFSHAMWAPQLDAVAARHRAVAYDLRGHGRSGVGDGQYTVEGHVDDLLALLDHLGIARAVLVGLSMGGYVALRAVERAPGRCRGLALCDTRSEADGNEAKLKRAAGAAAVKRDGAAAFADGFVKAVFAPGTFAARPEAVEAIRLIIAGTEPLAIAGTLLALAGRTDTTESLARIAVPTLIMVGEHDEVTPPDASCAMHGLIPQAELHIVPGAGHLSSVENPDFFNRKLLAFLDRCAG
ncbi:MAG: alpha/beta fold hydrolase [Krumholzibacteria bacterium]|nr:alpha/beta fold hydrolase [Candidatus Krumholzibacteria bacterium]